MSGGPRYEYLWADGDTFKKPTSLPASRYIELLMDWIESQINNDSVFPVSTGTQLASWICLPNLHESIFIRFVYIFGWCVVIKISGSGCSFIMIGIFNVFCFFKIFVSFLKRKLSFVFDWWVKDNLSKILLKKKKKNIKSIKLFSSPDIPFPKTFFPLCKKIMTRLFRVFVHVYIHHFDRIVSIGAEAHVNTCYKHFYYFAREFDLISPKELEPLKELTVKLCKEEWPQVQYTIFIIGRIL